jgi:hypothetical protein
LKAASGSAGDVAAYRRFNFVFLALVAGAWIVLFGSLLALAAVDRLPAPPVAGTPCMDAKFEFYKAWLNDSYREQIDLLAVGSSVTARNLDTSALLEVRPHLHPFNAAMCYLHVDQTAFLAAWLIDRLPNVRTVLMIAAMRDFKNCARQDRAFFETQRASDFVFGDFPGALVYATSLRPGALLRMARGVIDNEKETLRFTAWGDWPMTRLNKWLPEPEADPDCLPALRQLEEQLAKRGVRLVFVHFPTEPKWHRVMDPDGRLIAAHRERVRRTLTHPGTLIINGDDHVAAPAHYADPAHLFWPYTAAFTRFIAERLE